MRLQVQLILPSGARRSVQLPDEVIVGRLLPALLSRLALPLLDEAGQALRYELVSAQGPLNPERSLAAAAVAPDSELRLVAAAQKWDLPEAEPPRRPSFGPPVFRLTQADIDTMLASPEPERQTGRWNTLAASGIALLAGIFIFFGCSALGPWSFASDLGQPVEDTVIVNDTPADTSSVKGWAPWANTTTWPEVLDLAQIGDLVFLLQKGDQENLLWQITPDGEHQLLGSPTLYPEQTDNSLTVVDDTLYFWDGPERQLWRYVPANGLWAPAGFLRPIAGHLPLPVNDRFLYSGADRVGAQALYATASSDEAADPLPVRVDSAWHQDSVVTDGYRYFVGFAPETGFELWRTDGAVTGTELVLDIAAGPVSAGPHQLLLSGDYVYFLATDPIKGMALWRTHGPSGETELLANPQADRQGDLDHLTLVGDQLFFTATSSNRTHQLWRYSLTEQEFSLLEPTDYDISPAAHQVGQNEATFYFLAADSGSLGQFALADASYTWFFADDDSAHWSQLFVSGSQLLLLDDQGRPYQYLPGAETALRVTNVDDVADLLPAEEGAFLIVDGNARVWRLLPDNQSADFVVHVFALEAGDE